MEPESDSPSRFRLKGSIGLIVACVVIAVLLIALPAYRWFFLISVLIGLVIAGGLTLWHKLHPIEEPDVGPKRPLGLYPTYLLRTFLSELISSPALAMRNPNTGNCLYADSGAIHAVGE